MHQCIKFILFWNDTLHVSGGLYVHHQEFKTVHTATCICQTGTAVCLLADREQYLFEKSLLLYIQSWTPDDGRKDRPKPVECHSKIKFDTLVHLVGLTIEIALWIMEQNQVTCVYKNYLAALSGCFFTRENKHTVPNGHYT